MNELEPFEAYMKKEHPFIDVESEAYAAMRNLWQARVPDGYKLVPVDEYYELVRSNRYKHEQNIELSKEVKVLRDRKKYYKSKYKAMIELEK